MEIRVLRYFLMVVQQEGIHKAAEALHITQPTLSRQMSQLEEEVGAKLFARGPRKITLTDEGRLLYRRAQEIVDLEERCRQEIVEQNSLTEGHIVLGCAEMSAMKTIARLIASFGTLYPNITFDVITGAGDFIHDQLEKGLVDIGVAIEPIDVDRYEFIRMENCETYSCLMRTDDPLAGRERITGEDLKESALIIPHRSSVQNQIINWLGSYYDADHIKFTINFSTNGALLVKEKLGKALVVEGSLPFLDHEELKFIPLDPPLSSSGMVIWKRSLPFGTARKRFIDYLKENLSS